LGLSSRCERGLREEKGGGGGDDEDGRWKMEDGWMDG
jgi:hypothetical protein